MVSWQFRIFTQFNFGDKSHKIISDHTGVLSFTAFTSFLTENQVSFFITDSIPDMLSITSKKEIPVIITGLVDLPDFITNKYEHRHFTYADIPLNGQLQSLLGNQPVKAIIQLLDYCYKNDPHIVLTQANLPDLLSKSIQNAGLFQMEELISQIKLVLTNEPEYKEVLLLGKLLGELIYLSHKHNSSNYLDLIPVIDSYSEKFVLTEKMNDAFFASISDNPVTVDKILHNIKSEKKDKSALLCFDCMGWAEWFLLKDFLQEMILSFDETELFALLPTVTSISRSAIFQGSTDVYNIKTSGRAYEEKAFTSFFSEKETKFFNSSENITDDSLLGYDCISILFTFFDDIAHAAQIPTNGFEKLLYFDAINSYLKNSNLKQVIETLLQNGFALSLCSDHGSVVATGNGQRIEKYLIDNFAKRACIIPATSSELTELRKVNIPFVSDKVMILPEGREMFTYKGKQEINHGGITIEEMVVPYIKVKS
ncbi:MAG: PglZ domain-containing protein [Bacteroidales bacterium]|nr:PglZ domain-containing protein [Bacteroidales bacterium]